MYIMQYKCRSKTFDLGCIMSTNLLLFWVCNVFSCVASLWSFTGSSLRCSKTNRYVWTQTLHGSKLYGDFFLHINFKIPCSIKELFGESRFFGFSLLFELMDENKSDQLSMVFCAYFYSAVFVKKTVTADKNSELWSVPNNVRIQRSHRLAGPDTSLNNPCCCTHAPWLAPSRRSSMVFDQCLPSFSKYRRHSAHGYLLSYVGRTSRKHARTWVNSRPKH